MFSVLRSSFALVSEVSGKNCINNNIIWDDPTSMAPHTYHNGCKYMVLKQQFFTLNLIFLVFISLPLFWVLAPTCGQSNRTSKGQWWYPPWNHACTVFYTFGIHIGYPILIHWFGQAVMAKGLRQRCFGIGCVKSIQKIYWNSIQIDMMHTSIHM